MDIGEEILNGLARDIAKEEVEWGEHSVAGSTIQADDDVEVIEAYGAKPS